VERVASLRQLPTPRQQGHLQGHVEKFDVLVRQPVPFLTDSHPMETRRWTNPTQPQTLQIAVYLLYIDAVFSVLFGRIMNPLILVVTIAQAVAGFGIANEKRWGYWLGVAAAGFSLIPFAYLLAVEGIGIALGFNFLFQLIMPLALFGLLLHQQSREYQRIWFS
jgi:membrane-associated protease RseP (regulator of RpoE activity)